jgi:hypothetical protein
MDVVVMVHVALHQASRIIERERRSGRSLYGRFSRRLAQTLVGLTVYSSEKGKALRRFRRANDWRSSRGPLADSTTAAGRTVLDSCAESAAVALPIIGSYEFKPLMILSSAFWQCCCTASHRGFGTSSFLSQKAKHAKLHLVGPSVTVAHTHFRYGSTFRYRLLVTRAARESAAVIEQFCQTNGESSTRLLINANILRPLDKGSVLV